MKKLLLVGVSALTLVLPGSADAGIVHVFNCSPYTYNSIGQYCQITSTGWLNGNLYAFWNYSYGSGGGYDFQ